MTTSGSATRSGSPLRTLARGGTLNLAGTLLGGLSGILLVVTVTNAFAPGIAGTLFAATALFLIVSAVAQLGTDAGLAHAIQRSLVAEQPARAREVVWVALIPVLAVSVVLASGLLALAPLVAGIVGTNGDEATLVAMLRVLAIALPVATTYHTLLAATRALGTMRPNVVVEKLGRLGAQIVAVLTVALLGLDPVWLAAGWALPYALALVAIGMWYRTLRPTGSGAATGAPQVVPSTRVRTEFWAFTAPRSLAQICQVALQRADIVLVAALLSPTHAAIYTAATRFLVLGQLGTQAIQQVLQPQLSALFARDDLASVRAVFTTATAWLMALAWPIYLLAAIAAPLWLRIFGDGYDTGRWVLVILATTMLVAVACGPVDTVLLMAGRSTLSLANNAAALAVNLALNLVLIPWLGIIGAAFAWSAALLVRNLLPLAQVRRAFAMIPFGRPTAWVAVAAALSFASVPLLIAMVPALPLGWVLLWLPLGCACYGLAIWRGREPLGLDVFSSLLQPKRVLSS